MDIDSVIAKLSLGKAEETEAALKYYNSENRAIFTFESADVEKRRSYFHHGSIFTRVHLVLMFYENLSIDSPSQEAKLCEAVFEALGKKIPTSCQLMCLEALRILSRDKHVLQPVTTEKNMQVLMKLAMLDPKRKTLGQVSDFPVVVESLKCLCNIVFNNESAQRLSWELDLAPLLCGLLQKCKDKHTVDDIRCFNLRLIFLLSLLNLEIRAQLKGELEGIPMLTQALEITLNIQWTMKYLVTPKENDLPLNMQDTDCAMEALKALFNVTLDSWTVHNKSEADQYRYLASILRHILLSSAPTERKTEDLHSHTINLLSNLPASCLDVLFCQGGKPANDNNINMDAVRVLLDFLEMRIDKGSCYREGLTPVLTVLTQCSRAHRHFRKYVKAEVLPPLRDVSSRPEVGTTIRNKLVRLMTHVDLGVKQIAAEFLFVLCKERVDNLLKYTGYGNAAGLLAARGLLAGGRGESWYSDDEEDSDTEEYISAKPNINLITGHVEEPMPNPMDEMTEEQKEYEAMKLVNMFDKLSREDIIKPMGVRADGTMAPLEETIHCVQTDEPHSSDSD